MRPSELQSLLENIAQPRILVIGDLILDRYVSGEVQRISPEAPIPVLNARRTEERLGGAGNVAANLRSMDAEVEIVGLIGRDSKGRRLVGMLEELGVDTDGCVVDGGRPTIEKTRMVSGVQQVLRVDREDPRPIEDKLAREIVEQLPARIKKADAVVVSDYGKGLLTRVVLTGAIEIGRACKVPVLVDPKGTDFTKYKGATLITPNRKEAELVLGRSLADLGVLPMAARELMSIGDLDAAVITLGAQGMFHLNKTGATGHVPTVARAVYDVTGAGDTVISHLALALASELSLGDAVRLSNQAAGIVVGKRGAASVTREELIDSVGHGVLDKVIGEDQLDAVVTHWKADGRRIVFTNGCFDILHAGHVEYLRFARSRGDVLLIGVNDDGSVTRLKGAERPINELTDRMKVLAALEMVDGVVAFTEDTPATLIERVTPDVLVKGADWKDKGVAGQEWVESHGGEVLFAPLLPGRSTTQILERSRGQPS